MARSRFPGRNRPGTVGTLLPGMDAKLEPVPGISGAGQLWVRGPNVMRGYIYTSEPGKIVQTDEGWHDTGDICSIDEDGFIAIRGRVKRFAKIGGEMVSLAVVENCATSVWPDDLHAAVTLPDSRKGEQIILLTACQAADRADFVAFTRNHGVAELSIPKKIIAVDEIPVLGTGKIDYVAVEEMAKEALA